MEGEWHSEGGWVQVLCMFKAGLQRVKTITPDSSTVDD